MHNKLIPLILLLHFEYTHCFLLYYCTYTGHDILIMINDGRWGQRSSTMGCLGHISGSFFGV